MKSRADDGTVPHALEAAPEAHELVFENDRVRIVRYEVPPGGTAPMHSHPDHVIVHTGPPSTMRFTRPDGAHQDFDLVAGFARFNEALSHEGRNIAKTRAEGILVELK